MSSISPAQRCHLRHIAKYMRKSDKDEVYAAVGWQPLQALTFSFSTSSECYVMKSSSGDPFVVFGVAPLPGHPGVGVPWLLATPVVEQQRIFCLKTSLKYIDGFLQSYDTLLNFVDARNRLSIEWIKWCGFQIADYKHEFGFERRPFFQFSKMRT